MNKATLLFLLLVPGFLAAWDQKGHRIIAQVAKSGMDPAVIERVDFYLKGQSWEETACWMDIPKNNPKFEAMKPWHMVLTDKDKTYVKTSVPDLSSQLESCINLLRKRTLLSADIVAQQLRFLFHLVGDAHQPLHCGYASDKGGTLVPVKFKGAVSNVHKLWDAQLIDEAGIDVWNCSKILLGMKQKERTAIAQTPLSGWIAESRTLLPGIYDFKNGEADKAYVTTNTPVVAKQLTRAGLRLAAILNETFK